MRRTLFRPSTLGAHFGCLLLAAVFCAASCTKTLNRKLVKTEDSASLSKESTYLKVHLHSGDLYVLKKWVVDEPAGLVRGSGEHFDAARNSLAISSTHSIRISDVAIFETNDVETHGSGVALLTITLLSAGISAACVTHPKACFGSCPTFYAPSADGDILQAEGFSASIAPSFEARDVDALFRSQATDSRFSLRVTNEAYETHVIRAANLMVARKPAGGRVLATSTGALWGAVDIQGAARCEATEGDCRQAFAHFDGKERSSKTDGIDLGTREFIEMDFHPTNAKQVGIAIAGRQTFITTFLFYQVLSWMGKSAGEYLAAVERGGSKLADQLKVGLSSLGDIEVQAQEQGGEWKTVGVFEETGPLATDVQVVVFPPGQSADRIRLRLTRGHWRIDQVTRVELTGPAQGIELEPSEVLNKGKADEGALEDLRTTQQTLVAMPGDEYDLVYQLPEPASEYELFIASRGYYLEWMRDAWLEEENPFKLMQFFLSPSSVLRELAPAFKAGEAEMEEIFWKSQYVRP